MTANGEWLSLRQPVGRKASSFLINFPPHAKPETAQPELNCYLFLIYYFTIDAH